MEQGSVYEESRRKKDSGHPQEAEALSGDDSEHSVQSSDEDDEAQEVTRSLNSSTTSSRHMFERHKKKGPRHEGFKPLRTTNKMFDDLLK